MLLKVEKNLKDKAQCGLNDRTSKTRWRFKNENTHSSSLVPQSKLFKQLNIQQEITVSK